MFNASSQPALLANLGGAHLPPVALSISSRYQVCVDAGVSAATAFFDDLAVVGLHDHIACAIEVFTASVRAGMAATGDSSPQRLQAFIDAFAAGYLGRIHQELRLFHGEDLVRTEGGAAVTSQRGAGTVH